MPNAMDTKFMQRIEDRIVALYGEANDERLKIACLMSIIETKDAMITAQAKTIDLLRRSEEQSKTIIDMQDTIIKGMEAEAGIYAHTVTPNMRILQ